MVPSLGNSCSAPGSTDAEASGIDRNLQCAAMIAAADKLMAGGTVAHDPELSRHTLIAMMTYLNAYAIPKRLPEREGFVAVERARDGLLTSLSPAEILRQARICVEQMPKG